MGARRIRTADLLGAIQSGCVVRKCKKDAYFQGFCCLRISHNFFRCAGICGDMQGVGHSWREVPEICAGRLERLFAPPKKLWLWPVYPKESA
jgi:hypothetical protein